MNESQLKVKRTGFYPAAARDYLEPLRLLKGMVDHMIFCDIREVPQSRLALRELRATIEVESLPEASFFLGDALSAMACLKTVDVFLVRNDSGGEGGSGLYLLEARRLSWVIDLIKPNGTLITDKPNGFGWLPVLTSGQQQEYRVGDRTLKLAQAQPLSGLGLFVMTVN